MSEITTIEYNSQVFWIPPYFIEVLSDYICQVFESVGLANLPPNIQKGYIYCVLNRNGEAIGMVDIPLDGFLKNDTDKAVFIDLLNQTKALIRSKGPELSIETLDAFESRKTSDYFKSPWAFPIQTQSLIATIDIIIQMINGTWTSNNYSVHYAGFPNPRHFPEI
jgi:hypothetical protein